MQGGKKLQTTVIRFCFLIIVKCPCDLPIVCTVCWVDDMLKIKRTVLLASNHAILQTGGIRVHWHKVDDYFVSFIVLFYLGECCMLTIQPNSCLLELVGNAG